MASIKDGRWRNQKQRIIENYDKSLFIIENDSIFNSDNKCSSAYINTLLRDNTIYFTNSVEETVKFIKIIYDKLEHIPDRFVSENNSYISTVKTKTKKIENIDKEIVLYYN